MPEWNWFAFHPYGVSKTMLEPAQKAVRDRDRAAWQKIYDLLSQTHTRPHMSHLTTSFSPNKYTIISNAHDVLVRKQIPEESSLELRQALQAFIEHVSWLKLEGAFPRPRHWIGFEIDWSRFLKSDAERREFEHFKNHLIDRKEKLPDPFLVSRIEQRGGQQLHRSGSGGGNGRDGSGDRSLPAADLSDRPERRVVRSFARHVGGNAAHPARRDATARLVLPRGRDLGITDSSLGSTTSAGR